MVKRHLSITLESNIYQQVKENIPTGQISPLVNNLLKEYLKKKKKEQLAADYQSTARSKAMREEDKIWEGTIEDGIENE